jgi:hypothetical protein
MKTIKNHSTEVNKDAERYRKLKAEFKYTNANLGYHSGYWNAQIKDNDNKDCRKGMTFDEVIDSL